MGPGGHCMDRPSGEHIHGIVFVLLGCLVLLSGCATFSSENDTLSTVAIAINAQTGDALPHRLAPLFVFPGYEREYNRIGQVSARAIDDWAEISINSEKPTVYFDRRSFTTDNGVYTNLVYRIHFEKTPYRLLPFHLAAGGHPGVVVILTLDQSEQVLLVTTVNTCGCYAAVIPTDLLEKTAFPDDWPEDTLRVYGEVLPASLHSDGVDELVEVTIRPEMHRVMDLRIIKRSTVDRDQLIQAELMEMDSLKTLPLEDGTTTSFYYDSWPFKPWDLL